MAAPGPEIMDILSYNRKLQLLRFIGDSNELYFPPSYIYILYP
jgi:hypothetical protein